MVRERLTTGALGVAIGLLGLGMATVASAQSNLARPIGPNGSPTRVYVQMGLMDVDDVDSAGQSFLANVYVAVRWQDPTLAHDGEGTVVRPLDSVWHPQLLFVNQQRILRTLPEIVRIQPDGTVRYRQRVWGSFSQPLDVREFPFDTQDFEIRLASDEYAPDQVVFVEDPDAFSGLADIISLPDWEILEWALNFEAYQPATFAARNASFAMVFHARRYAINYTVKVILPLILIVLMSSIVFWIDPSQAGSQIGIATTSMLTLIAYRFMVGGSLPPVPYLTRIDHFILGSTMLVFFALIQAVVTSILFTQEKTALARRMDASCRVIFNAAILLITYLALIA